jgi:nuclear transport factor 2 (NTF2) superfamily protein
MAVYGTPPRTVWRKQVEIITGSIASTEFLQGKVNKFLGERIVDSVNEYVRDGKITFIIHYQILVNIPAVILSKDEPVVDLSKDDQDSQ